MFHCFLVIDIQIIMANANAEENFNLWVSVKATTADTYSKSVYAKFYSLVAESNNGKNLRLQCKSCVSKKYYNTSATSMTNLKKHLQVSCTSLDYFK